MKRIKYSAIIDRDRLHDLRTGLLTWFGENGRQLPWRETRDPYAVLVSEILLHQTTVEVVEPVYRRFLETFPTVGALADAPLSDIKAITDPLGYKVRGRWLKDIAVAVARDHGGRVPDELETLMTLPGVGRYTAGACLSFAYEQPAGVLDTNVARIVGRLFLVSGERAGAERLHKLWALAEAIVPDEDAWAFNQGLMDFGSLVCTARKPACLLCPFHDWCPSGGAGARAAEGGVGVVFWERPRPPRRKAGEAS